MTPRLCSPRPLLPGHFTAAAQAAGRCVLLTPPSQLPAAVRQLFHASTRERAQTGCLLEQVASHMLVGLGLAADACSKALQAPFRPQPSPEGDAAAAAAAQQGQQQQASDGGPGSGRAQRQLSRAALSRDAAAAAEAGAGQVLQAVSTIGAMAGVLQQHYSRVLAPHLAGSGAEARACVAGLAALVRAVDERVAAALQRCLAGLCAQAAATLAEQQQRADFCPPDAGSLPSLEEPTPAAAAACALLGAAVEQAERHLHGPNLAAFLAEVRCCVRGAGCAPVLGLCSSALQRNPAAAPLVRPSRAHQSSWPRLPHPRAAGAPPVPAAGRPPAAVQLQPAGRAALRCAGPGRVRSAGRPPALARGAAPPGGHAGARRGVLGCGGSVELACLLLGLHSLCALFAQPPDLAAHPYPALPCRPPPPC